MAKATKTHINTRAQTLEGKATARHCSSKREPKRKGRGVRPRAWNSNPAFPKMHSSANYDAAEPRQAAEGKSAPHWVSQTGISNMHGASSRQQRAIAWRRQSKTYQPQPPQSTILDPELSDFVGGSQFAPTSNVYVYSSHWKV